MDTNESILTSGGLSICGCSAAIAIREATGIDAGAATSFITIMIVSTIIYIPILPLIISRVYLNNETVGAWIGDLLIVQAQYQQVHL